MKPYEIVKAASLDEAKQAVPGAVMFMRHSGTEWAVAETTAGIMEYINTRLMRPQGTTLH